MGMTMTQKILAKAAGLDKVEAGQLIESKLHSRPVAIPAAMSVEPTPVEKAPSAP